MNNDSCVNVFRRFISRRGQVSELRSDNGTNLISTEKELRDALKCWNMDQVENSLIQNGVKWTFNPPAGAHHGGIWESIIRMVKRVLSSITKQQSLDDEGLVTVMCEVESSSKAVSWQPFLVTPMTWNHWQIITYCSLRYSCKVHGCSVPGPNPLGSNAMFAWHNGSSNSHHIHHHCLLFANQILCHEHTFISVEQSNLPFFWISQWFCRQWLFSLREGLVDRTGCQHGRLHHCRVLDCILQLLFCVFQVRIPWKNVS